MGTFFKKKHGLFTALFGVLWFVAMAAVSSYWAYLLKISGKIDWFLLGLLSYPPIGLFCYAVLAVGIVCVVWGIRSYMQQKKGKGITV